MKPGDLAELVRLPAALTVPGDTLAGAAAAGWPDGRRTWALPIASTLLYWAGMALNDYADRHVDAVERPERPIPSGRVRPREALALAAALTASGVTVAAWGGGRPALRVALPLTGVIWCYDLVGRRGPLGPALMAAARGLDVLMGAGGRRAAVLPALAVATHTAGLTALSRGEVHGASPATARAAVATTLTAAVLGGLPRRASPRPVLAPALAALFAASTGRAQAAAARTPDADTVRAATGAGIRGMIPLQASLLARAGHPVAAVALVAAVPAARRGFRAVSPT
ncbi:SCO3242 family prenyltransferase [Marinactinospora thermotolerans]|uniref:4-hydroxybenzoate polyprenyltransferase n=1 Tax=Marinactinospora thermotolerans DSM 45154 TaxID=1122192 RepID=A0A1T4SNV3_9ACTN|nr:UbiA family prenyltransferase [Marinactinospora thermotolerans]SKA29853.1 4-hydroxybenzoate polyprenyltransferase [Marinactinospora thermotolerans DSM 45154]